MYDLTGQRFGRLLVVSQSDERCNSGIKWNCICDCGNSVCVPGLNLRCGDTKSCGCLQKEVTSKRMTTHGATIGRHRERLYGVWSAMLNRTRNPNASNYKYYGGRGISVCDAWQDYQNFKEWALSNGYDATAAYGECTLDREDNNGDYCPENCRWVNMNTQAGNQRSTKIITYNGESHNLKEWSEILDINYSTMKKYIRNGKTIEEIIG